MLQDYHLTFGHGSQAHDSLLTNVLYRETSLNPVPNAQVCIWPFWSHIDIRPPWGWACLS
jgi:hypothetical protein